MRAKEALRMTSRVVLHTGVDGMAVDGDRERGRRIGLLGASDDCQFSLGHAECEVPVG